MKTNEPTQIPRKAAIQQTMSSFEVQEKIKARAYQIYEERGRGDGHELDDWLQAEIEILKTERSVRAA